MTAIDHAEISVKKPVIAGVAQLVEHPICNRAVGSSSLSASTISPIAPCVNTLICRHIICLQVMTDAQSDVRNALNAKAALLYSTAIAKPIRTSNPVQRIVAVD